MTDKSLNHRQAQEALNDNITIKNSPEKQYKLQICVDPPDETFIIKYTFIMESTTHKVIEIRRMESDFTRDWFLEDYQEKIFSMEQTLKEMSKEAGIYKMSNIL